MPPTPQPQSENPHPEGHVEQEVAVIEQKMRELGFRWTAQRKLISKVALENHDHFSADELLDLCRAQDQGVSRATVYRTLSMLEEAGFVEGLDTGDGGRKFEHTINHEHHDHMVCTGCGEIIEFHDHELEARQEAAAQAHGFKITNHSLKLFGLCQVCQQSED